MIVSPTVLQLQLYRVCYLLSGMDLQYAWVLYGFMLDKPTCKDEYNHQTWGFHLIFT